MLLKISRKKTNKPMVFIAAMVLMVFLFGISVTNAANRFSVASGNWNSTSTWATTSGGSPGASVPGINDDVFVEGGFSITVSDAQFASSLTFTGTGVTLTVNSGITLAITNAITENSSTGTNYSNTIAGAGTITCASLTAGTSVVPSSDKTTTLTTTIAVLTISGNCSLYSSDNGNNQNNATFALSSGTVTVGGSIRSTNIDLTQNTSTFTMASGSQTGILILGGSTPFALGAGVNSITLAGTTTVVNYTYAGGQAVYPVAYHDLTLSGSGTKTLQTGTTTIGGNLYLTGTASSATVVGLAVTGNLNIDAGASFNIAGFNFSVTGATSVAGTLTHSNVTGTKTFTGDVTISSGGLWNETADVNMTFAGSLLNNGTFTTRPGVHTFNGTTTTIGGANAVSIPSLTISGTTTNTGSLTVSTTLAGAGTLTNGTNAFLFFGGSSITPTLTATTSPNTVNYTGTAQTVKPTTYYNLTTSGTGANTTSGVTVNGILSVEGTATLSAAPTFGTSATLQYNTSTSRAAGVEWITPFAATGGVIITNTGTITLNAAKVFNTSIPLNILTGSTPGDWKLPGIPGRRF